MAKIEKNYKHEIHALAHVTLSVTSCKCIYTVPQRKFPPLNSV